MIKLNLDSYMNKNGLSIQDVAEKTGLSRNTISQLYNNSGKGIQFETLDRLTSALNIGIYDLFEKKLLVTGFNFKVDVVENADSEGEYYISLLDTNNEVVTGFSIQPHNEIHFDRNQIYFFVENIKDTDDFWILSDYLSNFTEFAIEIGFAKIVANILKKEQMLTNDCDVLFSISEIQTSFVSFIWHSSWIDNEDYMMNILKAKYHMNNLDSFKLDEFGDVLS